MNRENQKRDTKKSAGGNTVNSAVRDVVCKLQPRLAQDQQSSEWGRSDSVPKQYTDLPTKGRSLTRSKILSITNYWLSNKLRLPRGRS